jgi:epoxyqueuosine reductase
MTLITRIRTLPELSGADFFGVADLAPIHRAEMAHRTEAASDYTRAIAIGIALLHPIVDQLPNRSKRTVALLYKHHAYDLINRRLDVMASRVSSFIQGEGYKALPVPASQTVDDEGLLSMFPHKSAARLAGLGWIGKSCLLITPEAGPRVRWATVLTDADLEPTGTPMEERCGSCQQCIDACPPKAFTGRPFNQDEPVGMRFHTHKCKDYRRQLKEEKGTDVCGMCLYVCPHGRKMTSSQQADPQTT